MRYLKEVLGGELRQYSMVIALMALIVIFNITSEGRVVTSPSFQDLVSGSTYMLVLAIRMLMTIVVRQIDLSVGSVAGFVGMVMALSARDFGLPWQLAVLLTLVIGAATGTQQGFWLAKLEIPGFVTTLGGMMIFRGGVTQISRSISVPAPQGLEASGSGYLPDWGPTTGINNSTLLLGVIAIVALTFAQLHGRTRSASLTGKTEELRPVVVRIVLVDVIVGYLTWVFSTGRPDTSFPVPGLILVVLIVIHHTITQRTRLGRHIYAVSGNKTSATLSGVNIQKTYFLTMLNMSLLAALAGIMLMSRSTAAGPSNGTGWKLDATASVLIGGAAVSGGVGTVFAIMIGRLVVAVLNSGLTPMSVDANRTQVIKGLMLLAAAAFDVFNKQQGRPPTTERLFPTKGDRFQDSEPQKGIPTSSDS